MVGVGVALGVTLGTGVGVGVDVAVGDGLAVGDGARRSRPTITAISQAAAAGSGVFLA